MATKFSTRQPAHFAALLCLAAAFAVASAQTSMVVFQGQNMSECETHLRSQGRPGGLTWCLAWPAHRQPRTQAKWANFAQRLPQPALRPNYATLGLAVRSHRHLQCQRR